MSDDRDHDYFAERAVTEWRLAERSQDQSARGVHERLAELYAARLAERRDAKPFMLN